MLDTRGWVQAALQNWANRCPDDVQIIGRTPPGDLWVINHTRGVEFYVTTTRAVASTDAPLAGSSSPEPERG